MDRKLTKEQLQALLATMYSRPLSKDELDTVLEGTSSLRVAYNNAYSGLDIVDFNAPPHTSKVVSFTGRGTADLFDSTTLQSLLTQEKNGTLLYQMFAAGQLTIEQGDIKEELQAKYKKTQRMKHLEKTGGTV